MDCVGLNVSELPLMKLIMTSIPIERAEWQLLDNVQTTPEGYSVGQGKGLQKLIVCMKR